MRMPSIVDYRVQFLLSYPPLCSHPQVLPDVHHTSIKPEHIITMKYPTNENENDNKNGSVHNHIRKSTKFGGEKNFTINESK